MVFCPRGTNAVMQTVGKKPAHPWLILTTFEMTKEELCLLKRWHCQVCAENKNG